MDTVVVVLLSLPLFLLTLYLIFYYPSSRRRNLPPGPTVYPIIGNLTGLLFSMENAEFVIRKFKDKYSKILTLHIGSQPMIIVSDRNLVHKCLIQHGSVFASRPFVQANETDTNRLMKNEGYNVSTTVYGPIWRLLRRNLVSEILHPSRIKIYSDARSWVLSVVVDKIQKKSEGGSVVVVVKDVLHHAIFSLLVCMCFGVKFEEKLIRDIEAVQCELLLYMNKIQIFRIFPRIGPYLFRKRWKTMTDIRKRQTDIFRQFIDLRRQKKNNNNKTSDCFDYCYFDSLLELKLAEENGRRLSEDEIFGLCSEFLNGGTDTTSTTMEWVMANVVKNQDIQEKLLKEIRGVVPGDGAVEEEDLHKLIYLKAVIKEGLRRHPPGHFVLPHAVTEDVVVDGYLFPKDASLNFMAADIGWDARLWKDPFEFKPERFLPGGEAEEVDITGSKDIKMMPFGAGRRICPALNLAMLHLEYFIANLVSTFDWNQVDGEQIDLSEKPEFTIVMKTPLRCRVTLRQMG